MPVKSRTCALSSSIASLTCAANEAGARSSPVGSWIVGAHFPYGRPKGHHPRGAKVFYPRAEFADVTEVLNDAREG